jgi:hypothetical protein
MGDDNANATVEVQYRKAGAPAWKQGFPLLRTIRSATREQRGQWAFNGLPTDRLPGGWIFAGSVVDLEPETPYEVKLSLKDPDGGGVELRLPVLVVDGEALGTADAIPADLEILRATPTEREALRRAGYFLRGLADIDRGPAGNGPRGAEASAPPSNPPSARSD